MGCQTLRCLPGSGGPAYYICCPDWVIMITDTTTGEFVRRLNGQVFGWPAMSGVFELQLFARRTFVRLNYCDDLHWVDKITRMLALHRTVNNVLITYWRQCDVDETDQFLRAQTGNWSRFLECLANGIHQKLVPSRCYTRSFEQSSSTTWTQ